MIVTDNDDFTSNSHVLKCDQQDLAKLMEEEQCLITATTRIEKEKISTRNQFYRLPKNNEFFYCSNFKCFC